MIHIFDKRLARIPSHLWQVVTQIDECKGSWVGGARLNPQVLGRLKKSVLVTSTGASTRIEGARLTDEEVEKLMRGLSIQKFKDRDQQEVRGYYEVLQNVFESHTTLFINENTLKFLHRELLKYVGKDKDHRGEYKKRDNKVHMIDEAGQSIGILFDTTPAWLTPKEMQELVEWTRENLETKKHHPLFVIGHFLVEFLRIHPFQDGNGRLSRVLTNLLLLKQGYSYMPYVSHEKFVEDNKPDYYMALRKSQKTLKTKKENILPWLEFFLKIFHTQSRQAISLLSIENIEKHLSQKQLAVWEYLQKSKEATLGEISKATKIGKPTVSQALGKLLQYKKIERYGLGRATRYRVINAS